MKTIKVSEATKLQLNWLVARIEGDELPKSGGQGLDYSSDWAVGGPIKEKKKIVSGPSIDDRFFAFMRSPANKENRPSSFGDTELIAAMRCYVTSKLGDTAEVPEELT